jgi:hypothetical protein
VHIDYLRFPQYPQIEEVFQPGVSPRAPTGSIGKNERGFSGASRNSCLTSDAAPSIITGLCVSIHHTGVLEEVL